MPQERTFWNGCSSTNPHAALPATLRSPYTTQKVARSHWRNRLEGELDGRPGQAAVILGHLQAERRTGCLKITSSAHGVCWVYLLTGHVFHAAGPTGEGEGALIEAVAWPDAALSFDDKAQLPAKQTIRAGRGAEAVGDGKGATPGRSFEPTLSSNP